MNNLKIWSVNLLGISIGLSNINQVLGVVSLLAAIIYSTYGILIRMQEYKSNKKMKLTENFSKYEFDCNDGSEMPNSVLENIRVLANHLQVIRDLVEEPININSAYRSLSYNRSIGSKDTSQHTKGTAADLSLKETTPEQLYNLIELLMDYNVIPQGGLGLYNTFVHVDFRGYKARWNNSNNK